MAPCSSRLPCPAALAGQSKFPTAACLPPSFTLTSFSSSLDAPASKACPVSPSLAAFKLFILYSWFGALRKILIFYLSPFARSWGGQRLVSVLWVVSGGLSCLSIAPLWDCHANVPTCLVYILKRCTVPPPRGHHRSQKPSWRTTVWAGSRADTGMELTLSHVLWHLLDVNPALFPGGAIPHLGS